MKTLVRDIITDLRRVLKEQGIFCLLFHILLFICLAIPGIIFHLLLAPFYLLNEWSKRWLKS